MQFIYDYWLFSFNFTNYATKALLSQIIIACTGNIRQSLKVPSILYICTSILSLTRCQKSTCTL